MGSCGGRAAAELNSWFSQIPQMEMSLQSASLSRRVGFYWEMEVFLVEAGSVVGWGLNRNVCRDHMGSGC